MKFGLPPEAVEQICGVFHTYPQIESAVIYGSRAKGNYKDGSDIDLTLTGDKLDLNLLNRIDSALDDLLLPWSFDLSIFSTIKNQELINHINRVGIIFYQRNQI